jgi:lysophospholipase L1-like esterase
MIRDLTALGSSFAAGPGLEPYADRGARRSVDNYPHLVSRDLGVPLVDATVSGATTNTVWRDWQRVRLRRYPPQVRSVRPDADVVTVTAGGNDLGYVQRIRAVVQANRAMSAAHGGPRRAVSAARRLRALTPLADQDVQRAADGLHQIARAVWERAPLARVLFVDYLPLLGDDPVGSALPLTDHEVKFFRAIAARLSASFSWAAERSGADLIPSTAYGRGHAIGSADPWVTGIVSRHSDASSFHPTRAGMRAVADLVIAHYSGPH